MYARPATENIPLGLQYRPGDVRPRPAFRPGFRPRPNMIVRPGMEHYRPDFRPGPGMEGYRPAYRPYPAMDPNYRPHPSMDPKFRPRPNMDPNFRSAPSGMYSRPFPGRPYPDASRSQYGGSQVGFGGSDVGYQGGSEVGYQGGPGLVRRTSYMDGAQANHQPGPLRKTSMMEHNHRTGSPSLRKTSQMDIDVEGISRQNSEIVVSPLQRRNTDSQSPFSASESGYRQSVPVYNAESGLYSVPKPFDPSRPLYRGPPTSPNAIYGQSIRPPAQRAASYHYPQGYYRPSQSASFHSSDSNSVISTSFRPRPSGIVSELGLRTSPEPDLDSPVMEPGSPGKRK